MQSSHGRSGSCLPSSRSTHALDLSRNAASTSLLAARLPWTVALGAEALSAWISAIIEDAKEYERQVYDEFVVWWW